ncbi:MAG TPA: hypothetical protein VG847_05320 [Chitinophagaceae bacterium]|nr:hypothetical protein [Chitinophagaceae bacterium]
MLFESSVSFTSFSLSLLSEYKYATEHRSRRAVFARISVFFDEWPELFDLKGNPGELIVTYLKSIPSQKNKGLLLLQQLIYAIKTCAGE